MWVFFGKNSKQFICKLTLTLAIIGLQGFYDSNHIKVLTRDVEELNCVFLYLTLLVFSCFPLKLHEDSILDVTFVPRWG